MPNCTANPTAPPAGTPLLMVKLACFTCWDCQYRKRGSAAMKIKPYIAKYTTTVTAMITTAIHDID